MANPTALVIATSCFQAVSMIGYPECELILSQTVIYLATSPKSNSSYTALKNAKLKLKSTGNLNVPLHLRNAPTKLMKDLDYGAGYQYPHENSTSFTEQEYLPEKLSGSVFYEPSLNERENQIRGLLKKLWNSKYQY